MKEYREPTLVFEGLRGFYERMIPLSWLVVRLGVGWNLAYHGYGKIVRGMVAQAKQLDVTVPYLSSINLPLSYVLTFVEGHRAGFASCSACSRGSSRPPMRSRWRS